MLFHHHRCISDLTCHTPQYRASPHSPTLGPPVLFGGTHVTPNATPVVLTERMLGAPGEVAQMSLAPLGSWTAQPRLAQQFKGGVPSRERRRDG